MEVIEQPRLIDQIKIQLSCIAMYSVGNDPNAAIHGLDKIQATKNVREYMCLHVAEIGKTRRAGKPRFWFKPKKFREQFAKKVSVQGYGGFPCWIWGNPSEFQKNEYIKRALIDRDIDKKELKHGKNYLYTVFCDKTKEEIEKENMDYFPDFLEIGRFVSEDVYGFYPDDAYGIHGIFDHASIETLEVNQDLYIPDMDSVKVIEQLMRYFLGEDGAAYLYKIGCLQMTTSLNMRYSGRSMVLNFGRLGSVKIYAKTLHGVRVEVRLNGNEHIKKVMGSKNFNHLEKIIEKMVNPLFNLLNVRKIIEKWPPKKDLSVYLLEIEIEDLHRLNFYKMLHERRLLPKEAVPFEFTSRGKKPIMKGIRIGKGWMYKLKEEYLE